MNSPKLLIVLIAGALFGIGLAISGMTDPARVIGFLDVFGKWDPALVFVMAGAVAIYGAGIFLFRRITIRGCELPSTKSSPINQKLLIGSVIFGVGWGLGGFCPGPALSNLGALRIEAIIFVPMMAIGMLLVQRLFNIDR